MNNDRQSKASSQGKLGSSPNPAGWLKMAAWILVGTAVVIGVAVLLTPLPPPTPDPNAGTETPANAAPSLNDQGLGNPNQTARIAPRTDVKLPELPTVEEVLTAEKSQRELIEAATELTKNFPQDPKAYHVAGMIYTELKQSKKAEESWRKCLELKPPDIGPYVGLANLLIERGEENEAVALLSSLSGSIKKNEQLFQSLANGLSKLGELEKADSIAKEGIREFPNDASLWQQLGLIETQLRNFGPAESALRKAIELGDESTPTMNALATVLSRQGKTEETKSIREKLEARLNPSNVATSDTFQEDYLRAFRKTATPLFRLSASVAQSNGKLDLAERWLVRSIAYLPADPSTYMELSSVYRQSNRLEEALFVHQRLLEVQPTNLYNFINLASVATQLGRIELAEKVLKDATIAFPEMAFPFGELARLAIARNQFQAAQEWSNKASQLEPQNIEWPIMTAIAARSVEDLEALAQALQRARQISPNDPRLLDFIRAAGLERP